MAVPSWDVIRQLAMELEVQVEEEEDGWIRVHKYDSIDGIYQDSEAGRAEALATIEQHRRVMEESDAYRAKKEGTLHGNLARPHQFFDRRLE